MLSTLASGVQVNVFRRDCTCWRCVKIRQEHHARFTRARYPWVDAVRNHSIGKTPPKELVGVKPWRVQCRKPGGEWKHKSAFTWYVNAYAKASMLNAHDELEWRVWNRTTGVQFVFQLAPQAVQT